MHTGGVHVLVERRRRGQLDDYERRVYRGDCWLGMCLQRGLNGAKLQTEAPGGDDEDTRKVTNRTESLTFTAPLTLLLRNG